MYPIEFIYTLGWRGLKLKKSEFQELKMAWESGEFWHKKLSPSLSELKWRLDSINKWPQLAERDLNWISSKNIQKIFIDDPHYPKAFWQAKYPPIALTVDGDVQSLQLPKLCMVGSRNPSNWSVQWLEKHLPEFLHHFPGAIVSGGARGIDQAVHRACIRSCKPTIAFLPSGLQKLYPNNLFRYVDEIKECGGSLVSQFSPYQDLLKFHFHYRNTLMALLTPMVFVVEARQKSGTMMTAKLAMELNREIWTLPCCPDDGGAKGNLDLICDGATMIRDELDLIAGWKRLQDMEI